MIRGIVGWSLQFRLLVLGVAAAALLFGYTQLPAVAVDTVPEFTPPYVEIQTEALGLSAEEVEQLITVPLEADLLNGVAWLDSIQSESVPGLSSIVLVFEPGTDVLRARQVVAERMTQAHALPQVSKPPTMLQPLSSTSRVLMVSLASDELSLIDMSVLARWTIRPRLMGVPGVANVAIWGQRERQLQVQVDPARLRDAGVTLQQVIETTGNALWVSPLSFLSASTPGTGGFIDTPNQRLGIQHILPIQSADDLARVAMELDDAAESEAGTGEHMQLGDVAEVVEDHQPLIGDAVVNDQPGLMLVIEKFPDSNTLEVTRGIEAALAALRPGLTGMDFDATLFRPATFIESAINNLALAIGIGLVLLTIALWAFLLDWRAVLISVVTLALSVAMAALVLVVLGTTINVLVVTGLVLALAVLVDDVVVSADRARRVADEPIADDADASPRLLAAFADRGPLVYATVIVLLALVPVLGVAGAGGAFLPSVAVAYGLAVALSMLMALTVAPVLMSLLGSEAIDARRGPSPVVRRLQRGYDWLWSRLTQTPRRAIVGATAVTLGVTVLAVLTLLPREVGSIVPTFRDRDLLVRWDGPAGTSRDEMNRVIGEVTEDMRRLPGVGSVGAHIGRAVLSDEVVGIGSAELWIRVDPTANYDATRSSIENLLAGYPGLHHGVETYADDRIADVLSAPDDDLVVRVYGHDPSLLRDRAGLVQGAVSAIPGIVDAQIGGEVEEPTIQIEVDLAAAERYGIKPGDVRRASATLLSGISVGSLFEDQKIFDVVVWGVPELRRSVSDLETLLIDRPGGGQVQLGDVAEIRVASAPSVIRREGVSRYLDVAATVAGRDLPDVIRDVEGAVATIDFSLEYRAEVVSEAVSQGEEMIGLFALIAVAAIGSFLLLQAALSSWRLAAISFLMIPAAMVGGLLAGMASGSFPSLGAVVGLLAALGVATRHGLLLLSDLQRLEADGEPIGPALVLRGARARLAPVLLTAVATAALLLPFIVLGDRPGYEIIRPMSIVVLGGLASSIPVCLLVLPALYLRPRGHRQPETAAVEIVVADGSERRPIGASS